MHPLQESASHTTRRQFLGQTGVGLAALATLLNGESHADSSTSLRGEGGLPSLPHFAPRAKRVIYLFQSGAPSQLDLFDHKPMLNDQRGEDLPDSIRQGQRLTGMTATQDSFPIAPSIFKFKQHGEGGASVSELLPHTARVVDQLCFIKSIHTQAINHDPAITYFQTGNQLAGRPSIGAWISYGLGSLNLDLPTFVAIVSQGSGRAGQPLYERLWGSGFLPGKYQGVKFRNVGDPVLYLSDPQGLSRQARRRILDDLSQLNALNLERFGDPEIQTRIAQYELAFRMQSSVPELTDVSGEPEHIFNLYGSDARTPGTFHIHKAILPHFIGKQCSCISLWCMAMLKGTSRSIYEDGSITSFNHRTRIYNTTVGAFWRSIWYEGGPDTPLKVPSV